MRPAGAAISRPPIASATSSPRAASSSRIRPQARAGSGNNGAVARIPDIRTPLPGPKARALIERDAAVVSPSYTRGYPLVIERASGATVYVCAKDLKALKATPRDLIPGIHAVRGYLTADERVPDWERQLPWAPDRKAIAVCGG